MSHDEGGDSVPAKVDNAEDTACFMNPKRSSVVFVNTEMGVEGEDEMKWEETLDSPPSDAEAASKLCEAASSGDLDTIREIAEGRPELLDVRGPKGLDGGGGVSAIFVAAERNQCEAIDLLLELECSVNDREQEGSASQADADSAPRTWVQTVGGAALSFWRRGRNDGAMDSGGTPEANDHGGAKEAEEVNTRENVEGAAGGGEQDPAVPLPPNTRRSNSVSSVTSDGQPIHDDGETPMHVAARYGHPEAIKTLAKRRSSLVNCKRNDGVAPLHVAAVGAVDRDETDGNCTEALRELIALGAKFELDDEWRTPLHHAAEANNTEAIAVLIAQGMALLQGTFMDQIVPQRSKHGLAAVDQPGLVDGPSIEMLYEHGADLVPRELCGRQATLTQQPALIKLIRFNKEEWGVSDKQCEDYLSCLQAYQPAGYLGRAEVHPINCLSHTTGFSLLHHAVHNQHEEVVRLLVNLRRTGPVDFNKKSSRQAGVHRDKTPLQLLSCLPRSKVNPRIKELLSESLIELQGLAEATYADDIVELETMESLGEPFSKFVGQPSVIKGIKKTLAVRETMGSDRGSLLLFLDGSPGLGKTELAGLLAEIFHREPRSQLKRDGKFVQFDCGQMVQEEAANEFFGAPPGYAGGRGKLVETIEAVPNAVILLDEFDKAHVKIRDTLLAATDTNGQLTSNQGGKPIDTCNATFIFTSNLEAPGGFAAMRKRFGGPFASRVGETGYHRFEDPNDDEYTRVIARGLAKMRKQKLKDYGLSLQWTADVPRAFLAQMSDEEKGSGLRYLMNKGLQIKYYEVVHEAGNLPTKLPADAGGVITLYAEEQSVFAKILNVKTDDEGSAGSGSGDCGGGTEGNGSGGGLGERRRSLRDDPTVITSSSQPMTLPAPLAETCEMADDRVEELLMQIKGLEEQSSAQKVEAKAQVEELREKNKELEHKMKKVREALKDHREAVDRLKARALLGLLAFGVVAMPALTYGLVSYFGSELVVYYGLTCGLPAGGGAVLIWLIGGWGLLSKFLGMIWGRIPPAAQWLIMALAACIAYHILQSPMFLAGTTGAICCHIGRGWLDEIEVGLTRLESEAGVAAPQKQANQ